MKETDTKQYLPEADHAISLLRQMKGKSITLSCVDAGWLLAEIEGGREAFAAVVQQKQALERRVEQMQLTITDLSNMYRDSVRKPG